MKNEVKTLADAIRYFSDEQTCIDTVTFMRWPNGVECPACLMPRGRQHWLKNQRRWQCRDCGKQYSVKVNTIFEDSALSLKKWLPTMWLLANCKNGVSSYEIARSIGVTQKSAWFMLHRIREAMKSGSIRRLGSGGGAVEVDEAFIGPDTTRMHRKDRLRRIELNKHQGKVIVMGMLDRELRRVRAQVIPDVKRTTVQAAILNQIGHGSTIYTDNSVSYDFLKKTDFVHETVNHVTEYVRGQVHTNGIENFWSLLKRGLRGTYIAVEPYHLS
ncbi:MAG: IS1595 family transposase, partial [Terracidiphilus sp.]